MNRSSKTSVNKIGIRFKNFRDETSRNKDGPAPRSRVLLWSILGAVLLLAVGLLVFSMSGDAAPANYYIRILNESGQPVRTASCTAHKGTKAIWDSESSVLILPAGKKHAVEVAAPGYRIQRVKGIEGDGKIILKRGFEVRFRLSGAVKQPHGDRYILFRIRPKFEKDPDEDASSRRKLTEIAYLFGLRIPQDDTRYNNLPSKGWGFPVTTADAASGVLFPRPGRYAIHWGIMDEEDVEDKKGDVVDTRKTWFTLERENLVEFEVVDQPMPAVVEIPITIETMQDTRKGLRRQIEAMKAAAKEDARKREEGALPDLR